MCRIGNEQQQQQQTSQRNEWHFRFLLTKETAETSILTAVALYRQRNGKSNVRSSEKLGGADFNPVTESVKLMYMFN
jgi:hypothetical protein